MSAHRLSQTLTGGPESRLRHGLRYPLWIPSLVGVAALLIAFGTLGLVRLSNLRHLQPVEAHLALVSGFQQVTQTLALELSRELDNKPSDLARARAELDAMASDPRLLAEESAAQLERARSLLAEEPNVPRHSLALALGLLNKAWRNEMTAHTRLRAAADASARRETQEAMGLILVVGLCGAGLLVLMRGRIRRPLRDLERLLADATTGDMQQAPKDEADPPIRPLLSAYDEPASRLAGLEQERAQRGGRPHDEVHSATRTLLQQTREFDRAVRMAALGELAAELAHALRNPLAGIQMAVRRLRGELTDARQTKRLDLVMNELKRLGRLTDQLLERAEGIHEPAVKLDLAAVVDDVLTLARYQMDEGLRLESAVPPGLHCVLPEGSLRQALFDLVLNAGQAMQGRSGEIRVEAGVGNGRLQIRVADEGPGFPPPLLEPAASLGGWHRGGSGLGLAMVRRFARNLLGELRLVNRKTGGAMAIIDLPHSMVA